MSIVALRVASCRGMMGMEEVDVEDFVEIVERADGGVRGVVMMSAVLVVAVGSLVRVPR
jgi:hypothetical protein